MKRLSKIKLNASKELNDQEMKLVLEGYGSVGGDGVCAWGPYNNPSSSAIAGCTNSATRAEEGAGETGWWCCNCNAAEPCRSQLE